jgi:hypothetical protein
MIRLPRQAERGQILVIVAGGIVGILAILALVLEGGTLVLSRRDGQNQADLASMAGTHIVAQVKTGQSPSISVYDAVETSLDLNGCGGSAPCTWEAQFVGANLTPLGTVGPGSSVPGSALGVRVGVTRTPNAMVGRIFGIDTWTVSTEGTALTSKPTALATGVLLPIALCGWQNALAANDCAQASSPGNSVDFQYGQIYDLTDGKDAPGGFGWLSWDGSNSSGALATSLCTPNNPGFTLDSPYDDPHGGGETWFPIDPGKTNSSSVRGCLDKWIANGATILVPIYDLVEGSGNNARYHVTGVAAFVITSREQPAVDNIQGFFVEYYPFANVPGGATPQPPDIGDTTYFIGLVR